jgi:hypothetical protein
VGAGVGVGIGVIVGVGVIGGADVGVGVIGGADVGVVVAFISEFTPHPTKPGRSNNESNKMPATKKTFFLFILVSFYGLLCRPTRGQAAILISFRLHFCSLLSQIITGDQAAKIDKRCEINLPTLTV